jgi:hypothetical protein
MKTPKLIVTNGPFDVYRAGHVLIINRDDEFFCNLRKADRGFADPAGWVADLIRCEAEEAEFRDAAKADRFARAAAYCADRAARALRAPQFQF